MPDVDAVPSPLTDAERHDLIELEERLLLFFHSDVLTQYRAAPQHYDVRVSEFDGEITLTDAYAQELREGDADRGRGLRVRFGYRKLLSGEYAIAALAFDFSRYSASHIPRWQGRRVPYGDLAPLPDLRFETWAARYLFGSWDVENSFVERIVETIRLINAATSEVVGGRLFEHDESPHVAMPVSESDHAYQDAHKELYSYLLDGLSKAVILQIFERSGVSRPKGENGTAKLLKAALPSMATSPLWDALTRVSDERGRTAHKVRPPAVSFPAFETFARDLAQIHDGIRDLLGAVGAALAVDAERAQERQEAERWLPKIDREMENVHGVEDLERIVGRTIARIEKGLRASHDRAHGSDVVHIHFTDGSVVGIEVHSNARNVSSAHGDFPPSELDTNLFAQFVPPPQIEARAPSRIDGTDVNSVGTET